MDGWSSLLPQPHGLEGFGSIPVGQPLNDPAIAERQHVSQFLIERKATVSTRAPMAGVDQDPAAAEVNELLAFDTEVVERLDVLDDRSREGVEPAPHAGLSPEAAQHDVLVEQRSGFPELPLSEALIEPTHDLHVPPRYSYSRSPTASRASALLW
jgi:hypothetical protein